MLNCFGYCITDIGQVPRISAQHINVHLNNVFKNKFLQSNVYSWLFTKSTRDFTSMGTVNLAEASCLWSQGNSPSSRLHNCPVAFVSQLKSQFWLPAPPPPFLLSSDLPCWCLKDGHILNKDQG